MQRDYEELPAEAVPQLRDSLLQLLLKFGSGAPAVRTQLCLSLAALAAHLPAGQWGEGGMLRWLMDRMAGRDPAVAMSCMLELLTVLPQVRGVLVGRAQGAAGGWGRGVTVQAGGSGGRGAAAGAVRGHM